MNRYEHAPTTRQQHTATNAKKYVGKTRITQFDLKHPTNGEVTGTISGIGSGALTRTA